MILLKLSPTKTFLPVVCIFERGISYLFLPPPLSYNMSYVRESHHCPIEVFSCGHNSSIYWGYYYVIIIVNSIQSIYSLQSLFCYMTTKIFVNLPVKDLNKTIDFFTKIGFKFNPQFTDENATCMIVGEDIFIMLLVETFFKTFTKKEISDTSKNTEVIVALSVEGREKVDQMINNAIRAGGKESREPQDHGWMYGRSFEDIDGHIWEIIYMDESAMKNDGKTS
jgi:predicted lactoylglutathione lyase